VTLAFFSMTLLATELLGGPAVEGDQPAFVEGQRQRHTDGPLKRGIHELRDPAGWPVEPAAVAGPVDAARFDAAVVALCGEVAPNAGLPEVARLVREAGGETHVDAFLLAALVYRESRRRPGLVPSTGVGLLRIQAKMFARDARLPFPREALDRDRLLEPAANLRVGAALLEMWAGEHAALDAASGSTPYTVGAVSYARSLGAFTVAVTCAPGSSITKVSEVSIVPVVGPEVLAGSTRLKAGTAQKMVLNMLSTATLIRLGYVTGNRMSNLQARNSKLRQRAVRILVAETGLERQAATTLLDAAGADLRVALVMSKANRTKEEARFALAQSRWIVEDAVEFLRT